MFRTRLKARARARKFSDVRTRSSASARTTAAGRFAQSAAMTASAVSPETPTISVSHLLTRSATKAVTDSATASSPSFEKSATAPDGGPDHLVEVDFPTRLGDDLDRTLSGAPETEGVLGARRPLADREEPGHRVQPVCHAEELSGNGFGHCAFETDRCVVVTDRGPQLLRQRLRGAGSGHP